MPLQVMGRNKKGEEIADQHEQHNPQMRRHPFFDDHRAIDAGQNKIGNRENKNVIVEGQNFFADSKYHLNISVEVEQVIP